MLTVNKLLPQARGLAPVLTRRAPTVELDWDVRQKSRFDATDSSGRRLAVFLPRGTVVRGGDVLVGEDGSLVVVQAAAQPVLRVQACADHGTPFDLLRAAYHLGNRHVALELQPDRLQLEPDHVLAALLRQMHLIVTDTLAPFEPEGGAYAAAGRATGAHAGHAHAGHAHGGQGHGGQGPAREPAHDHDHDHANALERHPAPHQGHDPASHTHPHDQPAASGSAAAAVDRAGSATSALPAPTFGEHPQHDHGHHETVAAPLPGSRGRPEATKAAPHVHGPGCGHHHSH